MIDADSARYLLALLNLVFCTLIGWSCVCRWIKMTGRTTRRWVRAAFTLLFAGATSSGFSPILWQDWPGPGAVSLAAGVLLVLIVGAKDWKHGLPGYAQSAPAPLDQLPSH